MTDRSFKHAHNDKAHLVFLALTLSPKGRFIIPLTRGRCSDSAAFWYEGKELVS